MAATTQQIANLISIYKGIEDVQSDVDSANSACGDANVAAEAASNAYAAAVESEPDQEVVAAACTEMLRTAGIAKRLQSLLQTQQERLQAAQAGYNEALDALINEAQYDVEAA